MKTVMPMVLFLALTIGLSGAQTNRLDSELFRPVFGRRHEPPVVGLKAAVELAEAYMKTNNIRTNGYWIGKATLHYANGRDVKMTTWDLWWITASMGLGQPGIRICVDMDRRVWRDGAMGPSVQPDGGG